MKRAKDELQFDILYLEERTKETAKAITADPLYEVAWRTEDYFKECYMLGLLKDLQNDIESNFEATRENIVKGFYNYYLAKVLKPYNVREKNTGDMFRLTSIWKHEVELKFVEKLSQNAYQS